MKQNKVAKPVEGAVCRCAGTLRPGVFKRHEVLSCEILFFVFPFYCVCVCVGGVLQGDLVVLGEAYGSPFFWVTVSL